MSDRQQFIIDCTSLIPVIGTLVLIKIANEQMVTMVAAYVLCGELLGVLISRILRLYIIRKSKFPQNPKRSVRFSGKRTKRSVQKRKARNTQKAETKVL